MKKYIAMNRFKISLGREDDFEEIWRNRETYLEEGAMKYIISIILITTCLFSQNEPASTMKVLSKILSLFKPL